MTRIHRHALLAVLLFASSGISLASPIRLKDLVSVRGVRENQLFGYGLVVGLSGTGDTEQVFFTSQSISGMLGRLGIRVDPKIIRSRNVAAVIVTAKLATFARPGGHIDVLVSSMGNARSLSGGVLLMTPLTGPDGAVYALAQGPIQIGGYEASAAGSSFQKNQTNSGAIPAGGVIEKSVVAPMGSGPLMLDLNRPDFTNATRVAAAIEKALGAGQARALDPVAIEIKIPDAFKDNPVGLMARLEELQVEADVRAKVVVSERTGTVVAGEHVQIRPAAVSHGGLQVSISQQPVVSQPNAFSRGSTAAGAVANIQATETVRPTVALPATSSVADLVKALNLLGASSRDLISILQALKAADALDADLEVI